MRPQTSISLFLLHTNKVPIAWTKHRFVKLNGLCLQVDTYKTTNRKLLMIHIIIDYCDTGDSANSVQDSEESVQLESDNTSAIEGLHPYNALEI